MNMHAGWQITRKQTPAVGLIPPPPGVTPDFDNPPSTGTNVIIAGMVTWGVALIFVSLRAYVKLKLVHLLRTEDWILFIGWIFATGLTFLSFPFVYHSGLGRNAWNVSLAMFNPSFSQLAIAYTALYVTSIGLVKFSILLLYHRLSRKRSFRLTVYALLFLIVAYSLATIFLVIFRCHPISKAWDITITYGSCLSIKTISITNGFFNVITDITILILPIPIAWGLFLPKRQKILIVLMLMTSSLVFVVSVLRVWNNFSGFGLQNPTKSFVFPVIFGLLEVNIGTTCTCLPYMKPLLKEYIPKLIGEEQETSAAEAFATHTSEPVERMEVVSGQDHVSIFDGSYHDHDDDQM